MYMLKVPRSNRKWFFGECYPMSEMWRRHHTTTRPIECGLRCGLEMWRLPQRGQTRGHWQTGLLLFGESQAASGGALSWGPGGFDGEGWKVTTSKPLRSYFNSRRASINHVLYSTTFWTTFCIKYFKFQSISWSRSFRYLLTCTALQKNYIYLHWFMYAPSSNEWCLRPTYSTNVWREWRL